jgi:glucose-6-phosphate isomerase
MATGTSPDRTLPAWTRCDRTAAWAALAGHFEAHGRSFDLREAFARDPGRFESMSFEAPEVFADLSKNLLDTATLRFLADLARECGVEGQRDAMLAGAAINVSERRAVLHTALRAPRGSAPFGDEVHAVLDEVLAFAESVRGRADAPASADDIGIARRLRHVVNIGIGGSDLGPQMAVRALAGFAHPGLALHFVANVDGADLDSVLAPIDPEETLFVIASKTFTTQETIANAASARAWFLARGGRRIEEHFVAATSNVEAAMRFGITRTFGFWDWVGGRYSLWSAIGLPVAIAIGAARFRELLAGAHAMDEHFATAPVERNLPMLLGLVDVWYRNFHRFTSRCIAPYAQALQRLPAFLQQLEMESNGKRVDRSGAALPFATSPVVWGEPGTNAQHAYFQMLHQGSDVVPVEFILLRTSSALAAAAAPADIERQHRMLLANGLAQSQALMQGRASAREPHRDFPGNRPSTTFLLERLTPRSLGAFLALCEHRVFTAGALWGIDSFDQWGVELGKTLGHALLPVLDAGAALPPALDASTRGLIRRLVG